MTIEELARVVIAVNIDSSNMCALVKSLKDVEKEFEREERARYVDNDSLSKSYNF